MCKQVKAVLVRSKVVLNLGEDALNFYSIKKAAYHLTGIPPLCAADTVEYKVFYFRIVVVLY